MTIRELRLIIADIFQNDRDLMHINDSNAYIDVFDVSNSFMQSFPILQNSKNLNENILNQFHIRIVFRNTSTK